MLRVGPEPEAFIWASGVEDTFVPQTRAGQRALDEYDLMGHYDHWREDLALARDLGVRALRWGIPWYRVEPTPGNFDWRWTDEVLPYLVQDLGIEVVLDLMHYGCPFWLRREFASEEYPEAVAHYAREVARRYSSLVRWYTPLNEPLVNALMCGRRGQWPPYLRGDGGYIRVLLQLAKGILNTVEAIRTIDPRAVMVHVEATGLTQAFRTELEALAAEEQRRGFLCYDLLTGRVTPEHPLFPWLLRSGASLDDLRDIASRPIALDVLGMNFYPQWSTTQLYTDRRGRLAWRIADREGSGFGELIRQYSERYRAPVMITETSAFGNDDDRLHWLEASVAAVRDLRAGGVPVIGYTWFPMFTMIDWKYRTGTRPVNRYRIELGMWRLRDGDEGPRWIATPVVERFRQLVENPGRSVGEVGGATR